MSVFKIKEDHWCVMIDFMEKNKDFACGRFSTANGREHFRKLWKELAIKLNSLGYGERPIEKWQKSWADYKSNLKKKASQIKKWQSQTGGGPDLNKKLTDLELRVLEIVGTISFEGCGNKEIGLEHLESEEKKSSGTRMFVRQSVSPTFVFNEARGEAYFTSTPTSLKKTDDEIASTSKAGMIEPTLKSTCLESTSKQSWSESKNQPSTSKKNNMSFFSENCEGDHDYLPTPRKRMKDNVRTVNETDNVYKETVVILKNIETKVEQGLANINNTLDKHLSNIYSALLKKQ